jgi:ankyrin repeat protein
MKEKDQNFINEIENILRITPIDLNQISQTIINYKTTDLYSCDFVFKHEFSNGNTLLHLAVIHNSVDMLNIIMKKIPEGDLKESLQRKNISGHTTLNLAAMTNNKDIINIIKEARILFFPKRIRFRNLTNQSNTVTSTEPNENLTHSWPKAIGNSKNNARTGGRSL